MNIFEPINDETSGISWKCNVDLCNLNYSYIIHTLLKIINDLLCSNLNIKKNISNSNQCITYTSETPDDFKRGHNLACHYNYTCTSNVLFLKILGTHFPSIRSITNIFYRLQGA